MKLDQARCSSIYRIVSCQSSLHLATSHHAIAPDGAIPKKAWSDAVDPVAFLEGENLIGAARA